MKKLLTITALAAAALAIEITGAAALTSTNAAPVKLVPGASVKSIPVLVYHELDNGCAPSAVVCNAPDPESSSAAQFAANMAYLHDNGYHTVTTAQYAAWVEGRRVGLPPKPVLLTADNGISDFFAAATPVLEKYGFTMVAMIVTGFANGASGHCADVAYQPGCPVANENWDMTWSQLAQLPSVYEFALEAGSSGHFVQRYDPSCPYFYACKLPGESNSGYEQRVTAEQATAIAQLQRELGSRFTTDLWTVPYSDLGYQRCAASDCVPQPYDGPSGWLISYAKSHYAAAFVQDAFRNGTDHEHFRIDIQGWMSESYFEGIFSTDLKAGDFAR